MKGPADRRLADEAIRVYIDWREECVAVWDAFDRWASADGADTRAAFAAYRAALDREECAAGEYADLLTRLAAGKAGERLDPEPELTHPRRTTDSPLDDMP
jgi:hypothetical protein